MKLLYPTDNAWCPCNGACHAADGEGKVNYFQLANDLRTLKVR